MAIARSPTIRISTMSVGSKSLSYTFSGILNRLATPVEPESCTPTTKGGMSPKKSGWDGSTRVPPASAGTEAGSTLAWVEQSRLNRKELNEQLTNSIKVIGMSRRTPKRPKSTALKPKGLHERHAAAPLSPIETGVLDELQSLLFTAARMESPVVGERVAGENAATTPPPPPRPTGAGGGLDPAKTPHAGRVAIPTAKPGANTPRGSVGDLVATLEETKQLLGDRDEQLRKARTREAELITALESERQCVLRAERRVGVLERALGVAGPQGVFPVPADVHQEIDEMESSATNLEASFGAYLDEKSVTEHEHGAGTVMDPMDMVARAEAAVRGAIEETARAVCAETSANEAVWSMSEAETQAALAEALRASRRREDELAARLSALERDRVARMSVGSGRISGRISGRKPPGIPASALAKAASKREEKLERSDGGSGGFAPSPGLVSLLKKESSGHRSGLRSPASFE